MKLDRISKEDITKTLLLKACWSTLVYILNSKKEETYFYNWSE